MDFTAFLVNTNSIQIHHKVLPQSRECQKWGANLTGYPMCERRLLKVNGTNVEGEWTPCCWWSHRLPYAAPNPHWKKTWRLAHHHLTPSNSMILHDFHSLLSSNIVQGILCSQCPCKNRVLCSCEPANFSSACHSQKSGNHSDKTYTAQKHIRKQGNNHAGNLSRQCAGCTLLTSC